jgi:hypothetical protein
MAPSRPRPVSSTLQYVRRLLRDLVNLGMAIAVLCLLANIFYVKRLAPKVAAGSITTKEQIITTTAGANRDHSHHNHSQSEVIVADDSLKTFSACLLVMDDNHRLVEWLAYHYYLLPLRHLIILPDSKSRTSPQEIIDRWRPYMNIEVWTDEDFVDDNLRNYIQEKENNPQNPFDGFSVHIKRQEEFYKRCALHLQEQKSTWTTFIDVDEYVVINSDIVPDAAERMQQPGGLLHLVEGIRALHHNNSKHYNGPCITTYRTLYSAVESTADERSKDVPNVIDPNQFDTLRWRYHQNYKTFQHGKAFADLSLIPDLVNKGFPNGLNGTKRVSLHRFLPLCRPPVYHKRAYLRINHYLGSWEEYSYRQDRRKGGDKNRAKWEEEAVVQDGGASDEIRPWIGAFVRHFGEEKAAYLLEGAGLPASYEASDTQSWEKVEAP